MPNAVETISIKFNTKYKNMTLEQQVTSLELSKRLKELGVKQESVFTWVESTKADEGYKLTTFTSQFYGAVHDYFAMGHDSDVHPMYSAFTVAELGEMLSFEKYSRQIFSNFVWEEGDWVSVYKDWNDGIKGIGRYWNTFNAPTEADARAKMLVYLLENKLITL
jgi:hypothetical protein